MRSQAVVPVELRLESGGARLAIWWRDGDISILTAAALRSACRCGACEALRRRGGDLSAAGCIVVAEIVPLGSNAVRLCFGDGHGRGIYPFSYLRQIASGAAGGSDWT